MNLFYTDVLAKLWAGLDYHRLAPLEQVFGFRTGPAVKVLIEPVYWQEYRDLRATRLWFGTKPSAYKGDPGVSGGLNLAHVATRVYAAGSDPLQPGREARPSEPNRRVFGWWDRHYSQVADYEAQYHLQNQIMKWSVITGWLAANDGLRDLAQVKVDHTRRFDQWYAAEHGPRFRQDLRFLPESQWRGGTECLEILRSYSFPAAGAAHAFTEGGVSLGSSRSLNKSVRIAKDVPLATGRLGLLQE